MAEVRWTRRALDDLREIHHFIAKDSLRAAEALVDRILLATDRLERFPELGRRIPELPDTPYRELILAGYRVLYRPGSQAIWIAAVVHGRRNLEAAFSPNEE